MLMEKKLAQDSSQLRSKQQELVRQRKKGIECRTKYIYAL